MAFAPGEWFRDNARVYVGNASAVRDFRTQLRGNRAIWLWTLYLLLLIIFALVAYSQIVTSRDLSISEAQRRLQTFYQTTMSLLAFLITVIAPALTAGAVVTERQRRSLDLIFSAPVSPKYFLVGKLISSYRYVWMLLILALPVTASCVVLGGATWSDVLQAYAQLSLNALLFTACALLYSTICQKVVSAVLWSYLTLIAYVALVTSLGFASMVPSMMGNALDRDMPFTSALSPFTIAFSVSTHTTIFGFHVPNIVLAGLFILFLTRLLLLGAASSLSPTPSKDTVALRLQGLVGIGFVIFLNAWTTSEVYSRISSFSGPGAPMARASVWPAVSITFGYWILLVAVLAPLVACYGFDSESKFRPDGAFRFRKMLAGTPGGALGYLWAMVWCGAIGAAAGAWVGVGEAPNALIFSYVFWATTLVTLTWSVGRLTSALSGTLRVARVLNFAGLVVFWLLPLPFLVAMGNTYEGRRAAVWHFYMLSPLTGPINEGQVALIWGVVQLVAGGVLFLISERIAAKTTPQRMAHYG